MCRSNSFYKNTLPFSMVVAFNQGERYKDKVEQTGLNATCINAEVT